jgi:hypothetical protein
MFQIVSFLETLAKKQIFDRVHYTVHYRTKVHLTVLKASVGEQPA